MTVQQLAEMVMQRMDGIPQCSILDAVREVQNIITRRLFYRRDKSLSSVLKLSFAPAGASLALPTGFLGQGGVPYFLVNNARVYLKPVDIQRPVTAGTPVYYEVTSGNLVLLPPTLGAADVYLPSFIAPTIPVALTDVLPFSGAHDGIFIDGCTRMATAGRLLSSDKSFRASLQDQIDVFVHGNQLVDEQVMADEINNNAQL